jgi:hypothetical protein
MSVATLTWFTIGACLVYIVVQDGNVYDWLVLQSKRINLDLQRLWFKVRYHPDSPWVRYEIKRNADKLAAEFIKERDNTGN